MKLQTCFLAHMHVLLVEGKHRTSSIFTLRDIVYLYCSDRSYLRRIAAKYKLVFATAMSSDAIPDDTAIREKIYSILQTIDIETMGIKSFIQLLSKEMNVSHDVLKANKKDFIKQTLTEAINEADHSQDNDDDEGEEEDEEDDDNELEDQKPASSGNGRGLSQKKKISQALAKLLGKTSTTSSSSDNGIMMARTEVVKELWNYIRTHNLQNPDNKREILLDAAMQTVFGCTNFTMFTMNKYIGAHIDPFKPVDLTPKFKEAKSSQGSGTKRSRGRGSIGSANKKVRKVGTQPPYLLSDALQAVVGTDILPRPQVVSKIWTYIKAHDLQNPNDKREILCDDKLKLLFDNKSKISMFKMNIYIGNHLIEKVDKSQYHHAADDEDDDDDDEEE